MRSSRYDVTDEMIPLLPMVLQGHVAYADQAVNLTGNTGIGTLSSLRTGAGFYYTLTARGGLGETQYNGYYSTEFALWKADVLEKAAMLKETASLTAAGITGTERMGAEVYATSYADGRVLITNEGKTEASVMGITVPAGGYRILDEKGGD